VSEEGAELRVRVTPRSRANRVGPVREGVLQITVSAAPVDGAANRAVCRLIAERLGVPKSRVLVVRGETSRHKTVRVRGVGADTLKQLRHG
jgi:uncharacterized protein (TIGR00251 family)